MKNNSRVVTVTLVCFMRLLRVSLVSSREERERKRVDAEKESGV